MRVLHLGCCVVGFDLKYVYTPHLVGRALQHQHVDVIGAMSLRMREVTTSLYMSKVRISSAI
jgi:hypothetical protein